METACLRIKFTPLLQKNNKNSKCYLEIVPEVSCIQNLDKLTWKQETNFIEYTIPMTYKVILKKRQALTSSSNDMVKTYHSCVDLLLTSSKSTVNVGSGDVSKIISDTFIFSKTIANSTSNENAMNSSVNSVQTSDMIRHHPLSHKTTNTSLQITDIENKETEEILENVKSNAQPKIESVILDKASLDKITNTGDDYPFKNNEPCRNTVTIVDSTKNSSKYSPESRRKLSLSPICSVSTQRTPYVPKNIASKAITCKILDSQKDLVTIESISSPSNLSNDNQVSKELSTIIDLSGQSSRKLLRCQCRVPPEIRVAEHLQYMEKEVLPLKVMFNEILSKCSLLGITFSKVSTEPSIMYKSLSMHSSPVEVIKSQDISKSNRVVYTIVFDGMKNQQAVVEQIVQNLAFEVEAVPKHTSIQDTSISKSTPLNVKIRVRKKDEIHTQHEESSVTDEHMRSLQKIRLVSSDQTIMTFDVFMEAEFDKKPLRKSRKHIFDLLRPGLCLGSLDDDDYPYMPGASYSANLTEPSETTKSDGVLRQNFVLSKNIYENYNVSTQAGAQKWPFGKCKPGGCLDPPFGEDKYSYKPGLRSGNEKGLMEPHVPITGKLVDEDVKRENKSYGRHSSIFDNGLFKKKRKSSDKSTNTKQSDIKTHETSSNESIFEVESMVNTFSTHSNSIITYPPKISSDIRMSADKTVRSRGPSEDKSRKSFNEHSEPLFIPPKGVNRIKENNLLNLRENSKDRSSIDSNESNKPRDPLKLPVPVPIPIPIPFVFGNREPDNTNKNIDYIKTPDGDSNLGKVKPTLNEDISKMSNLNDSEIPHQLQSERASQNNDENRIETIMSPNPNISNTGKLDHEPSVNLNYDDANMSKNKLLPDKNINEDLPRKSFEKNTLKVPLPIPVPLPLNFGKTKRSSSLSNDITDKLSEESLGVKTATENNKHPSIQKSKESLSRKISDEPKITKENEILSELSTNSQHSELGDKANQPISKKALRTTHDSFESGSAATDDEMENVQGDMRRESSEEKIREESAKLTEQYNQKRMGDQDTGSIESTRKNDLESISNAILNENKHSKKDSKVLQSLNDFAENDSVNKQKINDREQQESVSGDDIYDMKNTLRSGFEADKDDSNNMISPLHSKENQLKITQSKNENENRPFTKSPTFINNRNNDIVVAPVFIEENKQYTPYRELKPVSSVTNLIGLPEIDVQTKLSSQFGTDDDDAVTHSSVSHELIGTKSVIYDFEENFPSPSSIKNTERKATSDKQVLLQVKSSDISKNNSTSSRTSDTAKISSDEFRNSLKNKHNVRSTSILSTFPSTSTLKSALKKDTVSVELAFHSYLNDKNERILKTFDASNEPPRKSPNDTLTLIKSQIRLSSNEIRIPVDSDYDLSIQIKKPSPNQRVSISESGFVKSLENGKSKVKSSTLDNDEEINGPETKDYSKLIEDGMDSNFVDLYEQELLPLQLIIKNLRDEIDVLAAQQMMFRDKIFCPKKSKQPRLVHSNKKCIGCLKK